LVDRSPFQVGAIATNYPAGHPTLPNESFALQEYYASCFQNGSLALLMFPISQTTKNIYNESNPTRQATLTIQSEPPMAASPRVALMGTVTRVEENLFESQGVEGCYVDAHRDTKSWVPSKWGAHASFWARFDPHAIYYVGGFGGLHFIGYIPPDLYRSSSALPHLNGYQSPPVRVQSVAQGW